MTPDSAIATAADYADAMITARRAKNILLLVLLLLLLAQLGIFFGVRYTKALDTIATTPTTLPSTNWPDMLNFLSNVCMFLAIICSIVVSLVLLLIVNIMLVGRLIGVARVTSAYIWSLLLLVLIFPWQYVLSNVGLTMDRVAWKIPGVLYTFSELSQYAKFPGDFSQPSILKWVRFVVMPLFAAVIVLAIRVKSNRGIRQALGEDDSMRAETGV